MPPAFFRAQFVSDVAFEASSPALMVRSSVAVSLAHGLNTPLPLVSEASARWPAFPKPNYTHMKSHPFCMSRLSFAAGVCRVPKERNSAGAGVRIIC